MRERITVVGAGPVGASAALKLADLGFDVTIIDRAQPKPSKGKLGVDIRNFALNPRSYGLLNSVIEWPEAAAIAYRRMVVWEERGTSSIEFRADDLGAPELGWLIEMSPLSVALWHELQRGQDAKVRTVMGNVTGVAPGQVVLENGERIESDLIIAADGGQSKVRSLLDVEIKEYPVDQHALATVVRTELPHQATAWQRFLVDGPVALLPSIENDLVSIVWSGAKTKTQERLEASDEAFCESLTRASESRLGKILEVDDRTSFPLTQRFMPNPVIDNQIVFIGDAARVVHPLAGLGVNLGFEDVEALLAVVKTPGNLCRPELWRKYVRGRRTRSETMIRTLGTLKQIYGANNPALGVVRNMGVNFLNQAPGIKNQIMREAMGLGPLGR